MDAILNFLIDWGYWGMLVSAFFAGSFFPFSSEAVMVGLQAAGLDPLPLIVYGTIGNVLGSMFNYGIGRMGRLEWIERYLHVKKESLDKAQRCGWPWSLDGILRLPANSWKCHNDIARIDEGKHRHLNHKHQHRKVH